MLTEVPKNPDEQIQLIEINEKETVMPNNLKKILEEARKMEKQMGESKVAVDEAEERIFALDRDFDIRRSDFYGSQAHNFDVSNLESDLNRHDAHGRNDDFWYEVSEAGPRQLKVICRRLYSLSDLKD